MKVVLLPGLDGTGLLFKPFIDSLPSEIKVQVISYPSEEKLGYSELVGYVLSKLPKEEFILVGESFSGPIAYQVALKKPDNLLSVVFVATFLASPNKSLLNLTNIIPTKYLLKMPIPNLVAKKYLFGVGNTSENVKLFKKSLKLVPSRVLSFRLREISKLKESHEPCDIKAIYIQATNDKLVPNSSVEAFKKVCKNLSVIRIKGTHFILQTNPAACAEILENEIRLITKRSNSFRQKTPPPDA